MHRRLVPGLAALPLLATAAPAHALAPTAYPTAAGPVMPGTSRVVDTWKNVGTWQTSAVQIAPRWVLSSGHSPMPEGATYRNARGEATIAQVYRPAIPWGEPSGADLTLYYLASPINAGGTFPKVLDRRIDSALDDGLPGWVLNAGYGLNGTTPPNSTTPTVLWSTPYGLTSDGGSDQIAATGGDSGGAQYWFPTPTAAPVLASLMVTGGVGALGLGFQQAVGGIQPITGEPLRQFMEAAFAAHAGEPDAAGAQFTTVEAEAGPLDTLKPGAVFEAWADSVGATSIRVAWINPSSDQVPRTGVKIYMNGVLKATAPATATSIRVTGLKWLTTYKVRVVSTGPGGDAVSIPKDDSFTAFTFL